MKNLANPLLFGLALLFVCPNTLFAELTLCENINMVDTVNKNFRKFEGSMDMSQLQDYISKIPGQMLGTRVVHEKLGLIDIIRIEESFRGTGIVFFSEYGMRTLYHQEGYRFAKPNSEAARMLFKKLESIQNSQSIATKS